MTDDFTGHDPWADLSPDEALRRVRASLEPRWYAWFSEIRGEHDAPTGQYIWAARRSGDGCLVHASHPGTLLVVVAETDSQPLPAPRHVMGEL